MQIRALRTRNTSEDGASRFLECKLEPRGLEALLPKVGHKNGEELAGEQQDGVWLGKLEHHSADNANQGLNGQKKLQVLVARVVQN
eukprot:164240-Pelagomonas_calceolata.AAC.3